MFRKLDILIATKFRGREVGNVQEDIQLPEPGNIQEARYMNLAPLRLRVQHTADLYLVTIS